MNSLNEIWKHPVNYNSFESSALLVRGHSGEVDDAVYILTNVVQKIRVKDGFKFQRIISIANGQPKKMTYLWKEGLIAVTSTDQMGNNFLTAFNYENGKTVSSLVSNSNPQLSCDYPVFSTMTTNVRFLFFNLAVPCNMNQVTLMQVNSANVNNNLTISDIKINRKEQDMMSVSWMPLQEKYLLRKANNPLYNLQAIDGTSFGEFKSGIKGNQCEVLTSTNGMVYGFGVEGGNLNVEAIKLK